MPSYYCFECGEQREFLNVQRTAALAQVTRATVYNWLRTSRLHVIVHPSGRKYVCAASVLSRPAGRPRPAEAELALVAAGAGGVRLLPAVRPRLAEPART